MANILFARGPIISYEGLEFCSFFMLTTNEFRMAQATIETMDSHNESMESEKTIRNVEAKNIYPSQETKDSVTRSK